MKKYLFHFIFLIILLGDLSGEILKIKVLDYIFKPLIMVWIAAYFLSHSKIIDSKIIKLAVFAFLFSWFGDILLMFSEKDFLYFILGLASFLIAQILYINLFHNTIKFSRESPFLKKKPLLIYVYVIFGLLVYSILYTQLNEVLKITVFIYMAALLSMSAMALNRFGNVNFLSFLYVFVGSLLFVLSDTMIAINKFLTTIPFEGLFIMSTYICAQYLIMRGLLKQYQYQ